MELIKDGQTISLDNENHINAFLGSGWAEVKTSAPSVPEEVVEEAPEIPEEEPAAEEVVEEVPAEEAPKVVEEKKSGRKKKQEN